MGRKIILGEKAGCCFGVKRALEIAGATRGKYQGPVYTLGPLIHNPKVVKSMEEAGIVPCEDLEETEPGGVLLIRSHGAGPEVFTAARRRGLKVVDATCPYVRQEQKLASQLHQEGYKVVVVGDPNHAEVQAVAASVPGGAEIIDPEAVKDGRAEISLPARVGMVCQTTQTQENLARVISAILPGIKELKIFNTICSATAERQREVYDLARQADILLVVGGRNSANTRKLAEIGSSLVSTYHIEGVEDLNPCWFRQKRVIGVTAGASTPREQIDAVLGWLEENLQEEWDMSEKDHMVNNEENQPEMETPVTAETTPAGTGAEAWAETPAGATVETGAETPAGTGAGAGTGEETAAETEAGAETPAETMMEAETEAADETGAGEGEIQPLEELEAEIPSFKEGEILQGRVVLVQDDAAYVDVGWKSDLPVPLNELTREKVSSAREVVNEGDTINVMVIEIEEDKIVLSRRRAEEKLVWERLQNAFREKQTVKGKVIAAIKGGLQVDLDGIPAFLPASHADLGYVPDLAVFVGQEMDLYIIEFSETRRRLVVSRKEVLAEEREKAKRKLFAELQVGDVRTGKITRLTSFGAFVELEPGVEGLLHISEIAWGRLDHPSERLQEGEEIQVKVIKVEPEAEKISLSIKQLSPHPWATVGERYREGDIVEGEVVRLTSFGAFVRLEEGIDGLVHISQLSQERVEKAEDVVKVGDKVKVKVLRVDPKERRIGLSIKETQKPEKVEEEKTPASVYLEGDEPLSSNLGAILSEKLAAGNGSISSLMGEAAEETKAEPEEAKDEAKEEEAAEGVTEEAPGADEPAEAAEE